MYRIFCWLNRPTATKVKPAFLHTSFMYKAELLPPYITDISWSMSQTLDLYQMHKVTLLLMTISTVQYR